MTAQRLEVLFGYYPVAYYVTTPEFSIHTLPDHEATVATITSHPDVSKDWIYPGAQQQKDIMSGVVRSMPYSARVFSLPKTHVLTLGKNRSREDLDFVVWCLSFFGGMRLTTAEAGFLDATPIKPGTLVDFILSQCTLADVAQLALDYLDTERGDPRAPKRVAAVVHALFLAQRPQNLPFEEFQYLYMALDACFSLASAKETKKPRVLHAERIKWMCDTFGMPVPQWAASTMPGNTALAPIRNDAFHEALFFDEPLGFAVFGGNQASSDYGSVTLQMQALVCRLVVAILGRPGIDYVRMPVDTRQRYALSLRP